MIIGVKLRDCYLRVHIDDNSELLLNRTKFNAYKHYNSFLHFHSSSYNFNIFNKNDCVKIKVIDELISFFSEIKMIEINGLKYIFDSKIDKVEYTSGVNSFTQTGRMILGNFTSFNYVVV
jgi:hypothetical protein